MWARARALAAGAALLVSSLLPVVPSLAAAPTVRILSPAAGSTVTSLFFTVQVAVRNFRIDCLAAGTPDRAGGGHIHVLFDANVMSQIATIACGPTFAVSGLGLAPGKHVLYVQLANNEHEAIAGAVARETINFQPKPGVSILYPRSGATVGPRFDLRLAVKNFVPSCELEGKPDIPGYGHLHVFVDPDLKGMMAMNMMAMTQGMIGMPCTTTIPINLSRWKPGPHTLMVLLVDNQHTLIQPMTYALIHFTLQS